MIRLDFRHTFVFASLMILMWACQQINLRLERANISSNSCTNITKFSNPTRLWAYGLGFELKIRTMHMVLGPNFIHAK